MNLGPVGSAIVKSSIGFIEFSQTQKDVTTLAKNEAAARREQAAAAKGSAAALERAQQGIRDFGAGMLGIAATLMGPLIPLLQSFASGTVSLISSLVGSDGFKNAVSGVTNWFKNTANEMKIAYGKDGFVGAFKVLFNKSAEGISSVWKELGPVIKPIVTQLFDGVISFLEPWFKKALDASFDAINDFIYKKTGGLIGELSSNRKDREFAEQRLGAAFWEKIKQSGVAPVGGTMAGTTYEKFLNTEMGKKLGADWHNQRLTQERADETNAPGYRTAAPRPPGRHSGTIGMTGNWWEKSDATLNVQQGESVVTQAQMAQIVGAAGQNGLAEGIQQLNSLVALQVKYAKETAEYARRNVDATKNLDGNLFARA
jgi:hypothetical protein